MPHRRSRHRTLRFAARAACCLATLGAGLAACGSHASQPTTVALLPDRAAGAHAWNWTPACPSGPAGPGSCAISAPNVGLIQLNADEWNLGTASSTGGSTGDGSVRTSLTAAGSLAVRGDLAQAPPCTQATCIAPSANTWVRGYTNVSYGIDQCHADASPPQSTSLTLPMRVSAIPDDLIGDTTYASRTPHVTYDIAYDLWLSDSDTKTPCNGQGTVEVMVWTDYDQRALLPAALQVGTADLPYSEDGVLRPDRGAWTIYASNIDGAGRTAPWGGTVWLVLDKAHIASRGTVKVDLSAALSTVGTLLEHRYGWHDFADRYWLDTVPFGMEFGPASGNPYSADPTQFALDLSAFCLTTRSTLAHATC